VFNCAQRWSEASTDSVWLAAYRTFCGHIFDVIASAERRFDRPALPPSAPALFPGRMRAVARDPGGSQGWRCACRNGGGAVTS